MSFSGSFNLASGDFLWNEECWHLPFVGGFSSVEELKGIVMCIPWGGTRTLPQGCTILSWPLLPCLCIPSLPWLAAVQICPLELRKGYGGWSLFPTNKKRGTWKGFHAQEPQRVLLGFRLTWGAFRIDAGPPPQGLPPLVWRGPLPLQKTPALWPLGYHTMNLQSTI